VIFLYSLLYVDDEPDLLEIGKIFLEQGGQFSVETVPSATAALDRLKSKPYDAIISDYQMPGMNGIELLKKVRTSGNTIPFILFTGRGREEVVIQAINEGADFYIQKGGDIESQFAELAHKIRQAVQQRQAQSSIRNLERREADLINFLPDATFAINAGGVVIAWNRAMEEMTGIPAREMLGKGNFEYALPLYGERRPILIDLVVTPGAAGADTHYKNIRREGPVLIVDTEQFRLRGKPVVLWGKASPLYDVSGTIVGAVETIRDITDRIRMEKALQESESNHRNLYQYAQVGLFKTGLEDGTIHACNELFTTSTGYSSVEEAIGTNIASVYADPGDRKEVVRILRKQGYIRDYVARFRNKKTGRVFWAQFSARLSREKGFVEGTVRDITENREAEEALRKSRAQLRTLVDTLPDMVWLKDPNGVYLSCNRRFEAFLGETENGIIGKTDYDFVSRDLADFFRRHDAAAIAAKGPVANEEELTFAADGHKEILETIKTPIFTSDGQLVGVLGVGRDITRRKQAEDEIRKSQAALEMANAQLNEAQRIASIGSWTYGISDEKPAWSRETFRIFGLDPQGGVPPYPEFRQLVHPDQLPLLDEAVEATLKTGKGYSLELRIRRPDGEERIVSQKCETVAGNDGGVPYILGTSQDITDSRKIRDTLLASETLFRTLVDSVMDPVLILSFDGRILFANPAAFSLVGHPETGITGTQSIARFLDPESFKRAMSDLEALRTSGGPVISEYRVSMLSGEKRWIEAFGIVIQYRGSGAELVTLRDITERKRSEEALRERGEKYRMLLSNIPDLILVHRDGIIKYVSPAMADSMGFQPEEIVNKPLLIRVAPEYHQCVMDAARKRMETGLVEPYEIELMPKTGERRTVIVRGTVIEFEGSPAILNVLTDVTDRREIKEALFESEEKFRSFVENANDIVFSLTPDGITTYVSPKWTELLGHDTSEIIGKPIRHIHPEDLPRVREFINKTVATGKKAGGIEYRIQHKDGSWQWHTQSISPVFGPGGRVIAIQGICHDITERRRSEEALRQANRNLKLLSGITRHDINNQLAVLRGHISLLSQHSDSAPADRFLKRIDTSAERIASLIHFTKEYEEIGAGIPVWQDCRTLVGMAASRVLLGNIVVNNDFEPGTEMFADPMVVKVFENLMDNAVRYGEKITTVRFYGQSRGDGGLIVYEDDGVGIPQEEKERIFARGIGRNTGLGLFLVSEILAITGITIRENGEPGKGARFEMVLPKNAYRSHGGQ
jgi:PAS domain S-box-containing protein